MRRVFCLAAAALLAFLAGAAEQAQAEWGQVGAAGFSDGDVKDVSLALDNSGHPYVVYSECMDATCSVTEARVKKFSGSNWTQIGAVTKFTGGNADSIKIALDRNEVPFVAFSDRSDGNKVRVMKFNGSSWGDVGDNSISNGEVTDISLVLDSSGNPSVAYSECVNGCLDAQVSMKTLNGTTWGAFNGAGMSVDSASYVSLSLNSGGMPYLAYLYPDVGNISKISAVRYDGTGWPQVGTAGFAIAEDDRIVLALNSSNVPYLAYSDGNKTGNISVMKFNDSAWEQVGTNGFSDRAATDISLAIDSKNTPYVAYSECMATGCEARVMQLNGSNWTQIGAVKNFIGGNADLTSLAVDKNGTLYLAYSDWEQGGKISVMQYSNSTAMPWLNLLLHKK